MYPGSSNFTEGYTSSGSAETEAEQAEAGGYIQSALKVKGTKLA